MKLPIPLLRSGTTSDIDAMWDSLQFLREAHPDTAFLPQQVILNTATFTPIHSSLFHRITGRCWFDAYLYTNRLSTAPFQLSVTAPLSTRFACSYQPLSNVHITPGDTSVVISGYLWKMEGFIEPAEPGDLTLTAKTDGVTSIAIFPGSYFRIVKEH